MTLFIATILLVGAPIAGEPSNPPGFENYQFEIRTEPDDVLLELDRVFIEVTLKNLSDEPIPYVVLSPGRSCGDIRISFCPEDSDVDIGIPVTWSSSTLMLEYPMLPPGKMATVFGCYGQTRQTAFTIPRPQWIRPSGDAIRSDALHAEDFDDAFRIKARLFLERHLWSDAVGPEGRLSFEKASMVRGGYVTADVVSRPIRLKSRSAEEKKLLLSSWGKNVASPIDWGSPMSTDFGAIVSPYHLSLDELERIEKGLTPGSARNAVHCCRIIKSLCEPTAVETEPAAVDDFAQWLTTLPELEKRYLLGCFRLEWSLDDEPSHDQWRRLYAALAEKLPASEFAKKYRRFAERSPR